MTDPAPTTTHPEPEWPGPDDVTCPVCGGSGPDAEDGEQRQRQDGLCERCDGAKRVPLIEVKRFDDGTSGRAWYYRYKDARGQKRGWVGPYYLDGNAEKAAELAR